MRRTFRRRRPVVLTPALADTRQRAVTRRAGTIALVAALAASAALVGDSLAGASALGATDAGSSAVPHVMVVMMENLGYANVIGNARMRYTNSLATAYGLATDSYAMGHPSLPNYLALVSASTHGVTSDESPPGTLFAGPTLANQLQDAGIPAAYFAEDLPADPSADSGDYVVHHVPWEYFTDQPSVQDPGANGATMLAELDSADPPDFVWFTPNVVDDGDGDSGNAVYSDEDAFLSEFVPAVQGTSWYADGGHIVIEWDEALDSDTSGINGGAGGHVPTIVVGASGQDSTPVDTVGILRSIEARYGLSYLGGSAADGSIESLLDSTAASRAITVTGGDEAEVGSSVTLDVSASGSPTPSIKLKGRPPSGLHFHRGADGTATITGTLRSKAAGSHILELTATYGRGRTKDVVTDAFTFTVLSATSAVHSRRR